MNNPITKDLLSAHELGIVTAFFDIGRGDWSAEKNHPDHLRRSTDKYFRNFATMAEMDNQLVVYTSPDLVESVWKHRRGKEDKTKVIPYDLANAYPEWRQAIQKIQISPEFIAKINPSQVKNPEYWSVDYIVVTNLKTIFTAHAVQNKLITTPMVAWIDFGFIDNPNALEGKTKWEYPFTLDKVHMFFFSPYNNEFSIHQVVANNIAYIAGGVIVARPDLWPRIAELASQATLELMQRNMVDDDQTIMLLAYLQDRDMFEPHIIGEHDWKRIIDIFHI